jgi:hypothetical protein
MRRLLTILYIVICSELGIFLFILPWTLLWGKNYFIDRYPLVSDIARNYFLRGAVSGLGLADIWLAVYEIRRLLRQPQASDSRSTK